MSDLLQALEDYLPAILGLVKDGKGCVFTSYLHVCNCSRIVLIVTCPYCAGSLLQHKVQFVWVNQEDDAEVRLEY